MSRTETPQEEVPRGDPPECVAFSLAALIDELSGPISQRAAGKGVGFRSYIDRDVPATVCGDPGRLRRVLENLLNNAVRFTGKGEVRIDIRSESEQAPDGGLLLRFTVIDTGIGIGREEWTAILDGEGLAVSRRMVRLMGDDIHVHSVRGDGTTFWFAIPFRPAGAPERPKTAGRPLRILIAEDNSVNQLILSEQISAMGHTSMTVSNGREAMEAVERSGWDAVLLDCQMPVMDGYQTVAAIRDREAAGASRTWTVAITANALGGEREACLQAGMDDFLAKPFLFSDLAQVISRIPPQPESPNPPVSEKRLADLAKGQSSGGGNLLERMVLLFTESGPEILDEMDLALAAGEFTGAVRAAHKLGGGCVFFGATELRALCMEAERLSRADDRAGIRAIAPRIRKEYERVEAALRQSRAEA